MPVITRKGQPDIKLYADLPAPNTKAPEFRLLKTDKTHVTLDSLAREGKTIILHTFPTLETENCRRSVEEFNKRADEALKKEILILCVSTDSIYVHTKNVASLPNVTLLCGLPNFDPKYPNFGRDYGVGLLSPDHLGVLFARAVIVIKDGVVLYSEYSKDLSPEGINYDACIKIAQSSVNNTKTAKDTGSMDASAAAASLDSATVASGNSKAVVTGDPSGASNKVVGFSSGCVAAATATVTSTGTGTGTTTTNTPINGAAEQIPSMAATNSMACNTKCN